MAQDDFKLRANPSALSLRLTRGQIGVPIALGSIVTREEYQRVRALIDSLDDVCRKAEEIRKKLEADARKHRQFPHRSDVSRLFNETPQAFVKRTPGPDDSPTN